MTNGLTLALPTHLVLLLAPPPLVHTLEENKSCFFINKFQFAFDSNVQLDFINRLFTKIINRDDKV